MQNVYLVYDGYDAVLAKEKQQLSQVTWDRRAQWLLGFLPSTFSTSRIAAQHKIENLYCYEIVFQLIYDSLIAQFLSMNFIKTVLYCSVKSWNMADRVSEENLQGLILNDWFPYYFLLKSLKFNSTCSLSKIPQTEMLTNNNNLFLTVLEAEKFNVKAPADSRACFLVQACPHGGRRGSSQISLQDSNLFPKDSTLMTYLPTRALPSNALVLGLRFQ